MIAVSNSKIRYGWAAMLLHWGMAGLIIFMLWLGLYMGSLPREPATFEWYGLHKSLGVLVLFLAVLRLIWRLGQVMPAMLEGVSVWQHRVAGFTHFLLYGFLFAMPLSGWMMSATAGYPVSFFGLFNMPEILEKNKALSHQFADVHEWCAYALIGLLIVHAGAALHHHLFRKNMVLRRMLPFPLP